MANTGKTVSIIDHNDTTKTVDGGAGQYKYDAGARRVMKVTAAETTYYAYGSKYPSVSGWRLVFVAAGGVKVGYRDNQTDHLGTPRVQTESAGNLVETWSYYPFGEQWEQTGSGGNERLRHFRAGSAPTCADSSSDTATTAATAGLGHIGDAIRTTPCK